MSAERHAGRRRLMRAQQINRGSLSPPHSAASPCHSAFFPFRQITTELFSADQTSSWRISALDLNLMEFKRMAEQRSPSLCVAGVRYWTRSLKKEKLRSNRSADFPPRPPFQRTKRRLCVCVCVFEHNAHQQSWWMEQSYEWSHLLGFSGFSDRLTDPRPPTPSTLPPLPQGAADAPGFSGGTRDLTASS